MRAHTFTIVNWKMKPALTESAFADDMVIIGWAEQDLQHNIRAYNEELKNISMKINAEKTKTTII